MKQKILAWLAVRFTEWLRYQRPLVDIRERQREIRSDLNLLALEVAKLKPPLTMKPSPPAVDLTPIDPHLGRM